MQETHVHNAAHVSPNNWEVCRMEFNHSGFSLRL